MRGYYLLGLCLACGAAISTRLGQDANFDFKNYHLYNAFAFLNWRYDVDFFPAAIQSLFNPLADVPYYILAMGPLAEYPRTLAGVQGLYYGLLIYFVWRLNRTMLAPVSAAIATAIGVTGAGVVSEIGTTFNDIQVALLVIAALALLLDDRQGWRPFAAGIALGGAGAIKLYGLYYAVAAVAALVIVYRRQSMRPVIFTIAGGIISFGVLYGWWAWLVWHKTGNPVFPYFNAVFLSPLYSSENFSANFAGWLPYHFIIAPVRWIVLQKGIVTENDFRDPRGFIGFLAASALALAFCASMRWWDIAERRQVLFLLVFIGLSYAMWLALFRLLRFGLPLEVVTGTLIMLALKAAARATPATQRYAPTLVGLLVLAGLLASTVHMSWGRVPFGTRGFAAASPYLPLPPDSLILITDQPTAYVLPLIQSPGMRAIGISYLSNMPATAAEITSRVLAHTGPIFTIRTPAGQEVENKGLALSWSECVPLTTNLDKLQLCRVHAHAAPP